MNHGKHIPIAIVDIDGTIANITHRLHHIKCPYIDNFNDFKPNWEAFHKACDKDVPIVHMVDLVNRLYEDYNVILCTGRMESNRGMTKQWLHETDVCYDDLRMRPDGDYRQDTIIKPEMFSVHELNRVAFAIDDRKQVIDMWRSMKILALQCAEGNF